MSMLLLILIFTYTIFTYTVCLINKSLSREQSVIVLEFGFLFFVFFFIKSLLFLQSIAQTIDFLSFQIISCA